MEQFFSSKHPVRIWAFGKLTFRLGTVFGMTFLIDGGGSRVISQLLIVDEIMHQIQWTLKLEEVPRPCDYAEMMVGSGLGA